ncbi:MAG: CPBP family intramembrane metalloprotease [Planctomycetes bacterium]|nr:CPBP family intramembrane metalloprotease [Planctomycetota bacterium]
MINRHVLHVFKKDGLEILRDRRTLFVNIVLPVLLYPLILLFMIQVLQLTQAQKVEQAGIVVVDAPDEIAEALQAYGDKPRGREVQPATLPVEAPVEASKKVPTVKVVVVEEPGRVALRASARELEPILRDIDALADRGEPVPQPLRERSTQSRKRALEILRLHAAAAAIVQIDGGTRARVVVLKDDASTRSEVADDAIARVLADHRQRLVIRRLKASDVPESALHPLDIANVRLAPAAEAIRTKASGLLPMLLVLLAASGAFFPALDLIAGERERGTLESLLSWPVRRRDVFVGKLLVACAAAAISVVLNILSLVLTIAIGGSQLAGGSGGELAGMFSVGGGALALSFFVLMPLTITLAAIALAVTGLANSSKEAQNYLTPMILVVMVAAGVAAIPGTRPSFVLDIIPITGPVLALKESLQATTLPWAHLALSTAASIALAAVVVGWSARLLEDERFRYPGLVRAGWGRFRAWGSAPPTPGGMEVIGVFALAVAGFTLGSGHLKDAGTIAMVGVPLIAFTLLPALAHCWLGAYRADQTLRYRAPMGRAVLGALVMVPFAAMLSAAIGALQDPYVPKADDAGKIEQVLKELADIGGLPLTLLLVALLPAICEETLCRGTLLSGLERGVGRRAAVVVSAFLFGILHLSPARFVPQFVLGLVLAIVTLRTRSIVPAMIIHAGHNGVIVTIESYSAALTAWGPVRAFVSWFDAHQVVGIIGLVVGGLGGLGASVALAGRRPQPIDEALVHHDPTPSHPRLTAYPPLG